MPNFINATEEANNSSLDVEAPTSHQDVFSSSIPRHAWVFEECESIRRLHGSIHQTRGTQNYRRQKIRSLAMKFIRAHRDFYLHFTEESINIEIYRCFVMIEEQWPEQEQQEVNMSHWDMDGLREMQQFEREMWGL